MTFWPKVWGEGESHQGEKQFPPLERLRTPYVSSVDQGSRTDVRGDFREITLDSREEPLLRYEFFMPQPIVLQAWPSGSTAYATQDPALTDGHACVAGSGVAFNGRRSRPVFSEILTPSADGPRFKVRPIAPLYQDARADTGVVRARNFFASWASWQNQKGPEWIHWPGNDGRSCCTSTRGFGPGLANMAGFLGCLNPPVSGGFLTSYANDVGKDVAPAFYDSTTRRVHAGAPDLPDYIDWRRAAVHVADGRKFFVLTDTHGYIHVYPAKDYGDAFRALPNSQFKSYLPAYPAWVAGPADGGVDSRSEGLRECFLWSFNANATRLVGVPFKEQEGRCWQVRQEPGVDPHADLTKFYLRNMGTLTVLEPTDSEAAFAPPEYTPGWWQVPGLVELGFAITVNGPQEMDFDVTITVLQESHWQDNGFRYYVDAGYLLKNRRMGDQAEELLGAPVDTLLTAEIELMWEPPATQPRIGRNTNRDDREYSYLDAATGNTIYNYEVHPDLPPFDVRGATARAQVFGLRNLAHVYYTVRRNDTQEVVRRFRLSETFGTRPRDSFGQHVRGPYSQLGYADLRSLTFMLTSAHSSNGVDLNGKTTTSVYAWNELQGVATTFEGADADALADAGIEAAPGDALVPIPGEDVENADVAMYFQQLASVYLIRLSFFRTFPVHPDGHWASALAANNDPSGKLDMIQAYSRGGAPLPRTSHLAQYNAAFGEARAADFHGAGATDNDIAPMATTGLWRISLP